MLFPAVHIELRPEAAYSLSCVPWYILTEQVWISLTNVVGPGTKHGLNVVMDRFRKDSSLTDEAPHLELFKLWKQLDAP